MKTNPPEIPLMQTDLGRLLRGVARELRATRLHKRGLWRWLAIAVLAFAAFQVKADVPALEPYYFPVLGLLLALGIGRSIMVARSIKLDYAEAARIVEQSYPDLKQALRTAAEQQPENGRFNYLQLRVINEALRHANVNNWRRQPQKRTRWQFAAHAGALAAALALTAGPFLLKLAEREMPIPQITLPHYGISVSPGNQEVERGSIVVVAARFDGRIPRQAEIVWHTADGKSGTAGMAKSLKDPVFMFTLPAVNNEMTYAVNYLGQQTGNYTLKTFDQPALAKADATLTYPDYTGLPQKTVANTRRVSAITGTKLQYEFTMNKPMKEVTLTDDKGNNVPVTATSPDRTHFAMSLTMDETEHLTMKLADDAGRTNPAPTTFTLTATPSQRPTVRVTFPVRDQRVSPIEEVHITATARDQFGLVDYGLAYSVGAGDPQYVSLKPTDTAKSSQATFSDVLNLEAKNVSAGDLVTWYAWADDYGPDGKVRRTTSDLAFAEVRPFETIFQEDDTAGAQMQQQQQQQQGGQQSSGNPVQDLMQLEQQISIATWNLKQQDKPSATFKDDVKTLVDSQNDAINQLADAAQDAAGAQQQAAAADAAKFMQQALTNLQAAGDKTSLDPLTDAWSGAQGAYQALLRMQSRNFRVTQTRSQGGQQSQQRNQMQDQLNQLQFRQQQNRYQTENQAQDPQQQQQNQMEAQSRLADLARRQQDLNQRLQELQTALAAAQDQQQRDELQRELQRLQDEQRSMLDELDQARQNIDQMQAGTQADQARQQLDQARENMRQSADQLAQDQVSQALASGTRADQGLQQTEENLRTDTANRFSQQMETVRQQARDLSTTQQNDGQQLNQLEQNASKTLDDSAARQTLAQSYTQQAQNLNQLMDQLRQITVDSEDSEPGLHQQLYDLLRQQSQATTADNLRNAAQYVQNGLTSQARPLQDSAAQNLDQLRQSVEKAAQSVLGNDAQAMRYAQNELNDLTQQLTRDRAATSDQFRDAGQQPAPGQDGQQASGDQTASNQGQNGARGGQQGANGQGQNGQQTTDQFAQNGANGNQPGQQGQQGSGQGQGQNGQPGQRGQGQQQGQGGQSGQAGQGNGQNTDQFAQNGENGQGQDQSGQGQGQGQNGQPGRGQGQRGGQRGQGGQGNGQQDQLAQDGQQGNGQAGGRQGQAGQRGSGQGRQGGRGQGQGQGAQGQGNPTDNNNADDGQLAQVDPNAVDQPYDSQPGNGQGRNGQRGGQRGNGRGGNGQNAGQLAQNDATNPGGRNGGGARLGGNLQNGGNLGGNLGANYAGGNFVGGQYVDNGTITNGGPITGSNFADWANRLRIVQNLLDDPQQRQQVANALSQAEDLRRNYLRHSMLPQWDVVQNNVMTPLSQVSAALHQQLQRTEQPDALQPVDQDPVPDRFANSVKSYYEALGN